MPSLHSALVQRICPKFMQATSSSYQSKRESIVIVDKLSTYFQFRASLLGPNDTRLLSLVIKLGSGQAMRMRWAVRYRTVHRTRRPTCNYAVSGTAHR